MMSALANADLSMIAGLSVFDDASAPVVAGVDALLVPPQELFMIPPFVTSTVAFADAFSGCEFDAAS